MEEAHVPDKKPRRARRTVSEKLADYLKAKAEAEERARIRRQRKADRLHYLKAKKRKAQAAKIARMAAWEATRQAKALDKARKQADVERVIQETRFKRQSRFNKLFISGFEAGKTSLQPELAQLKQEISHLQQLVKQRCL